MLSFRIFVTSVYSINCAPRIYVSLYFIKCHRYSLFQRTWAWSTKLQELRCQMLEIDEKDWGHLPIRYVGEAMRHKFAPLTGRGLNGEDI